MKLASRAAMAISLLMLLIRPIPVFAEEHPPGVLELKRFVVPGMSHDDTEEVVYSFTALLLFGTADTASVEPFVPRYRDIIITTTVGYRAFTQKNGRPFEPEELQSLIVRRVVQEPGLPVPASVVLQSFIAKALQPRS